MTNAYDYDPDARYEDDETGSAKIAQNAGVSGASAAPVYEDDDTNSHDIATEAYEGVPAENSAYEDEPKHMVDPQTQAAINAYIPDAEDAEALNARTEEQFSTAYDIIDQIDGLLSNAPSLFFSKNQVKIDYDEVYGLFQELKDVLPVQLQRASDLMRKAERRLENAQSQAEAIVNNAQAKSASIISDANDQARILAGQENVVSLATQQARSILSSAQEKANALTKGANDYTADSMRALDNQLVELRHSISTGLQVLQERQQVALHDLPHITPEDYPQD
ncbi:hypothetical protein QP141_06010 [Alloscardovia omnicolens]|uniref:hypothetical protein n=1 Tax=Alloscardovia omnicolens TaxID=419015 RepID=UPI000763FFD5|nr:hypothetical protein [Alloscardovia omnicolens]KWZ73375.1 hypothetical protein HMPREF3214_01448 [Alloscardovia omnicolens]MDK6249984.1 hypothetical protein [Alloscardovia omnicolens]MDK6251064.1 hypothetical protein [Alloscardovia omnicolens]MDK6522579.1 hypothetical protein [Alloscardovia omnicolens]MDK6664292.1 hypothetical protein [Alloscardovia omnicolens]